MSNFDHANGRKPEELASAEALEMTNDVDSAEPTIKADVQTPLHEPNALNEHAVAAHQLIAVNGKVPAASGWRRSTPLALEDAKVRMANSGNIGVRLRDVDLVIDVDPRHFVESDKPLLRLQTDFDLPEAPFVETGGGGVEVSPRIHQHA